MKVLFFALVLLFTGAGVWAQEVRPAATPEPPRVEVESQAGSPLRIVSAKTKWATPDRAGLELYVTVENVGGKAVSAYATRDAAEGGKAGAGGKAGRLCLLISAPSPGKALRPGRSEGRSTWTRPDPSIQLRRVVDFVEFTDGSTWGEDLCDSAETLAGSRAGAGEARRRLREIFAAGGADAVVEALAPDRLKVGPPEGLDAEWWRLKALTVGARTHDTPWTHSVAWWRSYLLGFDSYLSRVRRAVEEWGHTEVGHALARPLDALDERER